MDAISILRAAAGSLYLGFADAANFEGAAGRYG